MANTADTLGEQETLDGLIAHTLEDFEDSRITNVRKYAFSHNDGLKSVNLPNATTVDVDAFEYCYNLENINMQKANNISNYSFCYCYKLRECNIPNVLAIKSYSFYKCFSLKNFDFSNRTLIDTQGLEDSGFGTIVLPNATAIGTHAGSGTRTSTIDLYKNITISGGVFGDTYSLVHLILRSDTLCPLSATSAFTNTPIANGLGWIYVPSDLVESYKTASNWSTYADQIVSIDEYPKALSGETIMDSWDEIFQAEDNDSYKTKYSVGDTKYLVIGGTYVLMQIIAFDRDILSSDHTSTAKITWLANSVSFQFPMNFTNTTEGGWADCECRKFLNDTIYEQIPENVRNRILAVDKTYAAVSWSSSTATVSDKLWIPSRREIQGGNGFENTGIDYTDFSGFSTLKRYSGLSSNSSQWGLRSVFSDINFYTIAPSGIYSSSSSNNAAVRYCIGFCT